MSDRVSDAEAKLRRDARVQLLAVCDDLRAQIDRGEVHSLAYAASDATGDHVVTVTANAGIKPVTLLGALTGLMLRLASGIEAQAQALDDAAEDGAAN